ncbi:hypothetical protein EJ994_15615 [Maribacter sp. MJ134]|uniref:hypothetical protein n=1 Tax=Maribacter sp. MJ134 TaxID=2496865 RepID=UPI000F83001E|nr:hypothetical protein [Maribacter sp. MJ134]AZQ60158.1 hypothetical protein EJ994_15615 [Maribacter sp. MJ134]
MRNSLLSILLSICLFTCSNSEDLETGEIDVLYTAQKWQLVRMSGSFENAETTGENMEWQEFYVFNPDGSFLKRRETAGAVFEATGTFVLMEYGNDEADYLELTYASGENLIGSCNGDRTEVLVFRSSIALSNTWQACDGPGLDYVLVKD